MANLAPDSQIGPFPYRIVRQLDKGSGNMSDVYLATLGAVPNPVNASTVVIKIARTQDKHQQFFHYTLDNEVERLRQLNHPGIVHILAIQTNGGLRNQPYMAQASLPGKPWFMIMEHLKGGSLMDLIHQQKQMDVGLALEIIKNMAAALDYLHSLQQVHLDIKPENILFRRPLNAEQRLEPVLIDFGIARDIGQEGLEARTLHYAPPERILGTSGGNTRPPETLAPPHPSMDIYALGVTLYQMVTGRRPFEGRSTKSVSSAIIEGNPTEPSKNRKALPSEVDRLILKMMHKDPQARPSAYALAREVESIMLQHRMTATVPSLKQVKRSGGWGQPLRWLAGSIILLALVVGLFILAQRASVTGEIGTVFQQWITSAVRAFSPPVTPSPIPRTPVTPTGMPTPTAIITPTLTSTATPHTPTSTPVPEHTNTAVAAPMVTMSVATTPSATFSPTPTVIATIPERSPTSTPVEEIPTPTVLAVLVPTSTPLTSSEPSSPPSPTLAPTSSPLVKPSLVASVRTPQTSTSTPVPDMTETATLPPTATLLPTAAIPTLAIPTLAIQVTRRPSTPSRPTPSPKVQITLRDPADGTGGSGVIEFSWSANFTPIASQGFEVIFWKEGQEPLVSGFGLAAPTDSQTVKSDLNRLDDNVKIPLEPGEYRWGVLLVQRSPYVRLQYLGGGNRFRFSRGSENNDVQGNSGKSGGNSSTHDN